MASPRGIPDRARLWDRYGRHAVTVMQRGPNPYIRHAAHHFIAFSGAPHVDLNQAALFGNAGPADVATIADAARAADVPVLLARSATVTADLSGLLLDAGFVQHEPEALFWMAGMPALVENRFRVRRVQTEADHRAMLALFEEAHGYAPSLTGPMFGRLVLDRGVTGWIAWDGDEAASFALVTEGDPELGLFEVMTPPRHRRRGAASAVVRHALGQAAEVSRATATFFWASPLGRPFYSALGFAPVDTVDVWTLGANESDLRAVGVVPPGA